MDTRTNRTETPKPHDDYYLGWILKIAAAATVELPEASLAVYLERLRRLSAREIQIAATRTIEEWLEPSKMPPLSFILERTSLIPEITETVSDIRRRYQADFEAAEERAAIQALEPAMRHANVSRAEINQWLEEGHEWHRNHVAMLAAKPEWQALYEKFGKPGVKPREPRTWDTPEEKAQWAKDKAKSQGWRRDGGQS